MLRGLDYLRYAAVAPDERVAEAIDLVASKRDGDGRWPLEKRHPGVMPVEIDAGEGRPSRWNTLRALRCSGGAGRKVRERAPTAPEDAPHPSADPRRHPDFDFAVVADMINGTEPQNDALAAEQSFPWQGTGLR